MKKLIVLFISAVTILTSSLSIASNGLPSLGNPVLIKKQLIVQENTLNKLSKKVTQGLDSAKDTIKKHSIKIQENTNNISKLTYTVNLMQLQTPTHIKLIALYGFGKAITAELEVNGALSQYSVRQNVAPNITISSITDKSAIFFVKDRKITLRIGNVLDAYPAL